MVEGGRRRGIGPPQQLCTELLPFGEDLERLVGVGGGGGGGGGEAEVGRVEVGKAVMEVGGMGSLWRHSGDPGAS